MLLPNKVTTYRESVISKLPIILDALDTEGTSVSRLYLKCKRRLGGPANFLDALDCLFALNEIELDDASGVIRRADRNLL